MWLNWTNWYTGTFNWIQIKCIPLVMWILLFCKMISSLLELLKRFHNMAYNRIYRLNRSFVFCFRTLMKLFSHDQMHFLHFILRNALQFWTLESNLAVMVDCSFLYCIWQKEWLLLVLKNIINKRHYYHF